MIYLIPEIKSGLGEDTFWCWFERTFKNTTFLKDCKLPNNFDYNKDCIIVYSTKGSGDWNGAKVFALCWELYPEMKLALNSNEWDRTIDITKRCAKSATEILVATNFAKPYYDTDGVVDIMKLGVDMDVFKPIEDTTKITELRKQYGIPLTNNGNKYKRIGFWGGTAHRMKGFNNLVNYSTQNDDVFWIIVWKTNGERANVPAELSAKSIQFAHVSQQQLSQLMGIADFFLCTSLLRPYYMIEIEAMSCNLPFIFTQPIEKDFTLSDSPRNDVKHNGWDRNDVKNKWIDKFKQYNIEYVI